MKMHANVNILTQFVLQITFHKLHFVKKYFDKVFFLSKSAVA